MINLLLCQMPALNRVGQVVQSMINETLSDVTMLQFVLRLHEALAGWEDQAVTQLMKSQVMSVDKAGLRVDQKNHWIHVYCSGYITLKRSHRRRGKTAIESIHIIPRYGGIIVHDCWASYLSYNHCDYGLCGAHLLREFAFVIDANHYAWAKNMKSLLKKHYRNILMRGEKEIPSILPKAVGKRGKMAKSGANNLLERLRKHESAILFFVRNPLVAFPTITVNGICIRRK